MSEAKIEEKQVRSVKKVAKCPDCNIELENSGVQLYSNPPQHPYSCPNCGREFTLHKSYPAILFEEVN